MTDSYMLAHSHLISILLNDNNPSSGIFLFDNLHHLSASLERKAYEKNRGKFE